ncbi:hypothetical protein D9611_000728 [Ephemerocybe angulata]|uniref:Uncharacterized protein n=1 Tax=Ephemerocybe angulata TaxID=980116 RepID=A0A8H5BPM8_9AGAR|nr:hypothetical protein D9611_000728 [Tulosesus angulatus]
MPALHKPAPPPAALPPILSSFPPLSPRPLPSSPSMDTGRNTRKRKATMAPKPPKKAKVPKTRDFTGQLNTNYRGSKEDMRRARARFRAEDLRVISPSHNKRLAAITKLFVDFVAHQEHITDEEAAENLFIRGAPPASDEMVKAFLHLLATTGRSRVHGGLGWTKRTTKSAFFNLSSAMKRAGVQPFTQHTKDVVNAAIDAWAANREITTATKARPIIRQEDYIELQAAIVSPGTPISTGRLRVQTAAAAGMMYFACQRPGVITESDGYEGTGSCLQWGDTELLFTGYDEEAQSPGFQLVGNIHFAKNMRNSDGEFIIIHMHTLGRKNAIICPVLPFICLGIHRGVYEEDVMADYLQADPKILRKKRAPHLIRVKEEFLSQTVMRNAKDDAAWTTSGYCHTNSR